MSISRKITIANFKINLKFPDSWLSQSPLTHADLIQEAEYHKSAGFTFEFA